MDKVINVTYLKILLNVSLRRAALFYVTVFYIQNKNVPDFLTRVHIPVCVCET